MSGDKQGVNGNNFASSTSVTESPLLSILGGLDVTGNIGSNPLLTTGVSQAPLDLSSLLPTSGSLLPSTSALTTNATTALPLDADLDQLMKSLGTTTADAPKVSNDEINKLLDSIGVDLSKDVSMSSASPAAGADSLLALSRDLGIDLGASTSSLISPPPPHPTPAPNAGGIRPQMQANASASPATSSPHPSAAGTLNQPVRSGPMSMPTSPALMGLGGAGVPRVGALNSASTTPMRTPHPNAPSTPSTPSVGAGQAGQRAMQTSPTASATVPSQRPQQQQSQQSQQFRLPAARPQRPSATSTARRPPPPGPQQVQQQTVQGGVRPHGNFVSSPTGSPAPAAGSNAQRGQQRPQVPATGNRPMMRPRPHHGPAGANRGPRDSASPAGSPRSGSPVNQSRQQPQQQQQRPHPQQQQRRAQVPQQQQQQQQQQPHQMARPVGRPLNRPQNAGGASDTTSWLTGVMRSLPADRQERLAELLRGFQTGAIPPQVFLQQAQEMLGHRFSDLVAVTQNGAQARPQISAQVAQQQQAQMRPVGLVRPQAQLGVRPQNPLGVSINRPGMQMSGTMSSSSPAPMQQAISATAMSPVMSIHGPDGGQNIQMMQQLLLNRQQQQGNSGQQGMGSMLPVSMQGNMAPTQHQVAPMAMGLNPNVQTQATNFDDLINRFRLIIMTPTIPPQQLVLLSNQLNAYITALNDRSGPNANIPDDERARRLLQLNRLQSLIVRRQQQNQQQQQQQSQAKQERASTPLASEPGSRAASPKPERKKKGSAGKAKNDSEGGKGKKRSADSRRSDSPAPRGSGKRAKSGEGSGSEPNIDTLTTQLALAGPLLSLDTVSSISGSRGGANTDLTAGWSANQIGDDLPDVYVDTPIPPSSRVASRVPASRTSTMATNDDASDSEDDRGKGKERTSPKPQQSRKPREKREKERSGTAGGSGGDMFSIDDVIGYAGVDLREESDVFLHGNMPHSYRDSDAAISADDDTPAVLTYNIDGVDITRERSKPVDFADRNVLEALIAKACKNAHIGAVASDVAPYLSCALHDRLRTFMEHVSAAAYHRTRTQTLPPPPLDPLTRHPLYKITPNQDVKKQLSVLERVDRIREERREQDLQDREQRNMAEHQQPDNDAQKDSDGLLQGSGAAEGGAEGANGSGANAGNGAESAPPSVPGENGESSRPVPPIKRQKKKDDGAETPSYTSKNMPDDLRNKISNQTALRAAGGIRKSWMNAATPAWLANASSAKATPSRISARSPQLSGKDDLDGAKASDLHRAQSTTALPTTANSGKPTPLDISVAGHKRTFSGVDLAGGQDAETPDSAMHVDSPSGFRTQRVPPPLLPHRSTSLSTPLTVTVRDCLFSLEREKYSGVRVGRGSGERVLIQAYNRYIL